MPTALKDSQVSVRLPNDLKGKMEAYVSLVGSGPAFCPHGAKGASGMT